MGRHAPFFQRSARWQHRAAAAWAVSRSRAAAQSSPVQAQQTYELRVCTNKTCKRQGSQQVAKFGQDLALPNLAVDTCSCLGSCGNGPNMVLLTVGGGAAAPPRMLHHVSTPAQLVVALDAVAGIAIDAATLRATELRLAGNAAARDGQLQRAIALYSEALELAPPGTTHALLANRSAAWLAASDAAAALADADAAVEAAPAEFTTACVRRADALFALRRFAQAREALEQGAARHPPFGRTPDYKALLGHVDKALRQAAKAA